MACSSGPCGAAILAVLPFTQEVHATYAVRTVSLLLLAFPADPCCQDSKAPASQSDPRGSRVPDGFGGHI
jgi:hypothetical protein